MTEKAFMDAVIQLARIHGYKVMHIRDSRRQVRPNVWIGDEDTAGWPDLFLCHPKKKRALAMELKASKGKVTEKQEGWLDALDQAGIPSYLFRPDDLPLIQKLLAA